MVSGGGRETASEPATSASSAAKVTIEPPSVAAVPMQSSRSKAATSSPVGTTRIGAWASVARKRPITSPARPEFGGPLITATAIPVAA